MADIEKDLPDPLDTPAGGDTTDPDDLVAQLAGDAIDRLLEDAEKGIVPPRPKAEDDPLNDIDPPMPVTNESDLQLEEGETDAAATDAAPTDVAAEIAPADVPNDSADEASEASEPLPNPPPGPAADPPVIAGDTEPAGLDATADDVPQAMQAELDSLFSSLGEDEKGVPTSTPANVDEQPAVAVDAPPARTAMPPPVDVPPEIANDDGHGGTLADEDDHRPADLDNDASLQPDVKQLLDDATSQPIGGGAPAFIVAPLRLLNAPFAGLSDETRDLLGQIALVTLVNALAIMLYVILFR